MGLFRPYQAKEAEEPADAVQPSGFQRAGRSAEDPANTSPSSPAEVAAGAGSPVAAASAPAIASQATKTKVARPAGASARARAGGLPVNAARPVGNTTGTRVPQKKSAPTPTRKQAEAARAAALNPVLTKKEQRRRDRDARDKAQVENFRRVNEQPYMTMIRDWVDCRWSLAEFAMPVMLVMLLVWVFASSLPTLATFGMVAIYAVFVGVFVDIVVMWLGCRTQLKLHFPNEPLKGKLSYAMNRQMQMRRSRRPVPEVKRGSKFSWPRDRR